MISPTTVCPVTYQEGMKIIRDRGASLPLWCVVQILTSAVRLIASLMRSTSSGMEKGFVT